MINYISIINKNILIRKKSILKFEKSLINYYFFVEDCEFTREAYQTRNHLIYKY